jgi:hypothetical protein
VKETHRNNGETVEYRAGGLLDPSPIELNTGMMPETPHWRPSIFMHRWASRITLDITAIRMERLQDISEADATAEGVEQMHIGNEPACVWRDYQLKGDTHFACTCARESYRTLWESINGRDSWAGNPWVWVISFRRATA